MAEAWKELHELKQSIADSIDRLQTQSMPEVELGQTVDKIQTEYSRLNRIIYYDLQSRAGGELIDIHAKGEYAKATIKMQEQVMDINGVNGNTELSVEAVCVDEIHESSKGICSNMKDFVLTPPVANADERERVLLNAEASTKRQPDFIKRLSQITHLDELAEKMASFTERAAEMAEDRKDAFREAIDAVRSREPLRERVGRMIEDARDSLNDVIAKKGLEGLTKTIEIRDTSIDKMVGYIKSDAQAQVDKQESKPEKKGLFGKLKAAFQKQETEPVQESKMQTFFEKANAAVDRTSRVIEEAAGNTMQMLSQKAVLPLKLESVGEKVAPEGNVQICADIKAGHGKNAPHLYVPVENNMMQYQKAFSDEGLSATEKFTVHFAKRCLEEDSFPKRVVAAQVMDYCQAHPEQTQINVTGDVLDKSNAEAVRINQDSIAAVLDVSDSLFDKIAVVQEVASAVGKDNNMKLNKNDILVAMDIKPSELYEDNVKVIVVSSAKVISNIKQNIDIAEYGGPSAEKDIGKFILVVEKTEEDGKTTTKSLSFTPSQNLVYNIDELAQKMIEDLSGVRTVDDIMKVVQSQREQSLVQAANTAPAHEKVQSQTRTSPTAEHGPALG